MVISLSHCINLRCIGVLKVISKNYLRKFVFCLLLQVPIVIQSSWISNNVPVFGWTVAYLLNLNEAASKKLYEAVLANDFESVQKLLKNGAGFVFKGADGN